MLKKFLPIGTILLGCAMAVLWYLQKPNYIASITLLPLGPTVFMHIISPILIFVCTGALFIIFHRNAKSEIVLNHSPLWYSLIFLLITVLLINFAAYIRILFPLTAPINQISEIFSHNVLIVTQYSSQILWICIAASAFHALGKILWNIICRKQNKINNTLLEILILCGIGIVGWTMILYVLGFFELLSKLSLLTIYACIIILTHETWLRLIPLLFRKRKITFSIRKVTTPTILLIILFLSATLIDSLRPTPRGFDDATTYLNKANLIAQTESVIPGGRPYPFELLAATSFILKQNAVYAYALNMLFAVLAAAAIYGLATRIYPEKRGAIIAAATWLFLPMTWTFLLREVKVELLLFFITTLSLWVFIEWLHNPQKKYYLYLCCLFSAMAITIKIASLFFIAPLLTAALILSLKKHHKLKCTDYAIALACGTVPLVMWFHHTIITQGTIVSFEDRAILLSTNRHAPSLQTKDEFAQIGIDKSQCVMTGYSEDIGRFSEASNSALTETLLPWISIGSKNDSIHATFTDTSFLFSFYLILAIILTVSQLKNKRSTKKREIIIITLAFSNWLLWYLGGENILWYNYPGMIFLLLLIPYVYTTVKNSNIIIAISYITIAGLLVMLTLRMGYFGLPHIIQFATTQKTTYGQYVIPLIKELNNPQNSNKKILMTAHTSTYYIKNNHNRILLDRYLDKLNCIIQTGTNQEKVQRLRDLDIEYYFFANGLKLMNSESKTLQQKILATENFAKKNLIPVIESEMFVLYKIPQQ